MFLRSVLMVALHMGFASAAIAQNAVPAKPDRQAELRAAIGTAFQPAHREMCKDAAKKSCGFFGLVIESGNGRQCSQRVLPIDRFRIGNSSRYGVIATAIVSTIEPKRTEVELPILFLTQNDALQRICIEDRQNIAGTDVGISFEEWKGLSRSDLENLPDSQTDPLYADWDLVSYLVKPKPPIRAPGMLDWIFNSGRQVPIKLRINSEPKGGTVYVGTTMIGKTAQEFGLTPMHFRNVHVLLKGKRIPISKCIQVGSEAWVKILCKLPDPDD